MAEPTGLTAPYHLEYAYKRGLGPVLGAFFSGLQRGELIGVRGVEGEVFCPPTEYHPQTAEALSEIAEAPSERAEALNERAEALCERR